MPNRKQTTSPLPGTPGAPIPGTNGPVPSSPDPADIIDALNVERTKRIGNLQLDVAGVLVTTNDGEKRAPTTFRLPLDHANYNALFSFLMLAAEARTIVTLKGHYQATGLQTGIANLLTASIAFSDE